MKRGGGRMEGYFYFLFINKKVEIALAPPAFSLMMYDKRNRLGLLHWDEKQRFTSGSLPPVGTP
jgi:hypothetical protein